MIINNVFKRKTINHTPAVLHQPPLQLGLDPYMPAQARPAASYPPKIFSPYPLHPIIISSTSPFHMFELTTFISIFIITVQVEKKISNLDTMGIRNIHFCSLKGRYGLFSESELN